MGRQRRGGTTCISVPLPSYKALSSINQSCMHYTWLSVHPGTHTHTSMNPQKPTKAVMHFQNHDQVKKAERGLFFFFASQPMFASFQNMCSYLPFLKQNANMTSHFFATPCIHLIWNKQDWIPPRKRWLTNHTRAQDDYNNSPPNLSLKQGRMCTYLRKPRVT